MLVHDAVTVEIKAASRFSREHEDQLLNYLRPTPFEVGLLLNFGSITDFLRRIFDNDRKCISRRPNAIRKC